MYLSTYIPVLHYKNTLKIQFHDKFTIPLFLALEYVIFLKNHQIWQNNEQKKTSKFTQNAQQPNLPTKDGCSLTLTSPDLKQENPFDILQSKSFVSAGKSSSCFPSV